MTRNKVLSIIKELDENEVYPYLYDVMTDGSDYAEECIHKLEACDTYKEVREECETMFVIR